MYIVRMKKALIILLFSITPILLTGCTEKKDPNEWGRLDAFASCTAEKWLKMYGTERCPHCQKMKAMFGTAFAKVTYIDCDKQKVQCDAAKVAWYPTFMINGQSYPGEQTLEKLAELTKCELPATETAK